MGDIVLVDYDSGNVRSVERALIEGARLAGVQTAVRLSGDPDVIRQADRIVLPGQGAFRDCMDGLSAKTGVLEALTEAVLQRGAPFLGVCVGMQLLMTTGLEHGERAGLGWIAGVCDRLATSERLPHMGWNAVRPARPHPVLDGLAPERHMYFLHSFAAAPADPAAVAAVTDHGGPFAAAVARGPILGVQFHPEKSQAAGLDVLRRFVLWSPA